MGGSYADLVAHDAPSGPPLRTQPSHYVCAANVHMAMSAYDDNDFRRIVNGADLVLADGVPMVWGLRALGLSQLKRVRVSPDLVIEMLAGAEAQHLRLGLYGGTPETLRAFSALLADACPDLDVAYAWSPPFRPLTPQEDRLIIDRIRKSGVQLLLVGIGCPKQERWMAAHCAEADEEEAATLQCVMVGVGAAFDMLGGRTKNAPTWMRDRGLEWLFRLASEPRRLWRRHLLNDPRFLALFAWQLARERIEHRRRRRRQRDRGE